MSPPSSVLVVGGSRGLGLALVKHYVEAIGADKVFATIRGEAKENQFPKGVHIISNVDASKSSCGEKVVEGLQGRTVGAVIYVSGLLKPEEFGKADWDGEVAMYQICAIAPVIIIQSLVMSSSLAPDAKILFLTSEAGSLTLRTKGEGGGMYGHHASKAAGNMVGKLLSYDLAERGIPIAMIHVSTAAPFQAVSDEQPGFLKTEMTKNAGLEQYYEKMGAVTPEEASKPMADFLEALDMSMSGKMWAPSKCSAVALLFLRGPADNAVGGRGIGNAEEVMGKEWAQKSGPLELPW